MKALWHLLRRALLDFLLWVVVIAQASIVEEMPLRTVGAGANTTSPHLSCIQCIGIKCNGHAVSNRKLCQQCTNSNAVFIYAVCHCLPYDVALFCAFSPPAPAPPPPPPRPADKWPSFKDATAMKASVWSKYYLEVYGEIPTTGYPIVFAANWMIYDQAIVKSKIGDAPTSVGSCPTSKPPQGQRYNMNNMYSPPFLSWIWQPYPYKAVAANTWVEVLHEEDPFGDEHFGVWFVYAPGSGIYFNTGKTISFAEHADGYHHFGITGGNMNERMSKAAAAQGFDSVQFLAHVDHVNYQCDTKNTGRAGLEYMGLEIVGAKLTGVYACAAQAGAPSVIRAGWQASKPCTCDNTLQYLNCAGVPTVSRVDMRNKTTNRQPDQVLIT